MTGASIINVPNTNNLLNMGVTRYVPEAVCLSPFVTASSQWHVLCPRMTTLLVSISLTGVPQGLNLDNQGTRYHLLFQHVPLLMGLVYGRIHRWR